jgi:ATP-dependent exoDNAse (exonuclease V) alpha subunit
VAIYYLNMKSFGRGAGKRGSRATSGAAYRAGERIRDERTGAIYDHSRRADVMHKEIILPARLEHATTQTSWAHERAILWNAAEHAEARANARVAREFTVALPHELGHAQRVMLAQGFARDLVERYGTAVDLVVHAPRGDPRNFHAHLFMTTREVTPDGLGAKAALELSGTERHRRGLPRFSDELRMIRERWASFTNAALLDANVAMRVSARRGQARDQELASRVWLPPIAFHIERRGGHSVVAARLRAAQRSRLEREPNDAISHPDRTAESASSSRGWNKIEQLQARAIERWRMLREAKRANGLALIDRDASRKLEREPSLTQVSVDHEFEI